MAKFSEHGDQEEQYRALRRFRALLVCLFVGGGSLTYFLEQRACRLPGFGFGIGRSTSQYLNDVVRPLGLQSAQGRWLRKENLPEPTPANQAAVAEERAALSALRSRGFKSCILLRFHRPSWKDGVRAGGGYRLPVNLVEAYDRGAAMAAAYGDLVDYWEIDNEPDISFVEDNPEAFAAYHKALYFGLRSVQPAATSLLRSAYPYRTKPKVLMAPMALPPGPYFDRLLANDLLSYTDGVNYHYYGYAEDFTGVYRQFERAIADFTSKSKAGMVIRKELPVFLTEYGYGLLSGPASATKEGRDRQRRWFNEVSPQIFELRIEGPMVFTLNSYLEVGHNEFGLFQRDSKTAADPLAKPLSTGEYASSALKTLWAYAAAHPYQPRSWIARVSAPSPIVIDFLSGNDLTQIKSHLGYQAGGRDLITPDINVGQGRFVLYNFGNNTVSGTLVVKSDEFEQPLLNSEVTLLPGARQEYPVTLRVSRKALSTHLTRAVFSPENPALSPSYWSTALFPMATGLQRRVTFAFDHTKPSAAENETLLRARALAQEEPRLNPLGRWLVSEGVDVQEANGNWRFQVTALPKEPLRPAMVELPLPSSFRFPAGQLLNFTYKLGNPQVMDGAQRPMLDVYFRTTTGNLYQVWPRQFPTENWQTYSQLAENFTLGFFGRAEGPWRFAEQRPIALVFFLRPTRLPAVFDIANPGIVTFECP